MTPRGHPWIAWCLSPGSQERVRPVEAAGLVSLHAALCSRDQAGPSPPAFLRAERWGSSVWPGSLGRAFLAAGASWGFPGAALCTSVLSWGLGAGFLVHAFLAALRTPSAPASLSEAQEEAPWLAFQEKHLVFCYLVARP